jgi:Zn-dependent M28 family amino/carboxypeptidase
VAKIAVERHMKHILIISALSVLAIDVAADDLAQRWRAHVASLADDSLEGRDTGSEGHRKAAEYVASRFKRDGLKPAGTSGYLQPVRFHTRRIVEERSSLALVRDGAVAPIALGDEATFNMRVNPAPEVEAPLVFAGYGLSIPEAKHDDFADVDVKGKVVVFLSGAPSAVPGPLAAHYQSAGERWAGLRRAGAIGTITIQNPRTTDVPWERSAPNRLQPSMTLADPALDDTIGQRLAVTFNPARADRLFEGSGHTFSELLAIADAGKVLPRFPLKGLVRAAVRTERTELVSHNVAGLVPGSDPRLQRELVVLTAHLDHLGVGAAINGDRIYNGAMDNASGIATLLEAASDISKKPPKRSVVFLAVTAEEKGLLGSRYFAAHPTLPRHTMVANINMDMFLPLFPMKSLMVLGLDESDLGADVKAVAASMDLAVQADPEPGRNRFIRSDQYSFIRRGIPSLAMKVGYEPNSSEARIAAAWTKERYHAPSDDLTQPIDLEAAAGFTRVIAALCERTANRPDRPRWNTDSFFSRFARTVSD